MTIISEWSPCPYLHPWASCYVFSPCPVEEWKQLWWASGMQPGPTHHTVRPANRKDTALTRLSLVTPIKASGNFSSQYKHHKLTWLLFCSSLTRSQMFALKTFRSDSGKQTQTALLAVELMKLFILQSSILLHHQASTKISFFPARSSAETAPCETKGQTIPATVPAASTDNRQALPAFPTTPVSFSLLSPAPETCRNLIISKATLFSLLHLKLATGFKSN